jgi:hypothetical protein
VLQQQAVKATAARAAAAAVMQLRTRQMKQQDRLHQHQDSMVLSSQYAAASGLQDVVVNQSLTSTLLRAASALLLLKPLKASKHRTTVLLLDPYMRVRILQGCGDEAQEQQEAIQAGVFQQYTALPCCW